MNFNVLHYNFIFLILYWYLMAIPRYSVLKGKVIDSNMVYKNGNDHFIIIIGVSEHKYKAYVNIYHKTDQI